MSDRNRYDYLNLENFEEGIDSRDYRRRQPDRRNMSYDRRPPYNTRKRRRRRNRKRIRNRIIIVTSGVLVLALLISLIAVMANGCGKKNNAATTSTETKAPTSAPATTQPATSPLINTPTGDKLSLTNYIAPQPTDDNSVGVDAGSIYVWNRAGFELFGGGEDSGRSYAQTINDLAGRLPGLNVYSMIVPNHTEMGLPARLKSQVATSSQADNMKAAYSSMDTTKVKAINPYNYLSEHCNEYIYFKSDHHWTGLGAYYAYTAFADTLELPKLPLMECTEQTINNFTGTFSEMAQGLDTDEVHYWKFPYNVTMDITDEDGNKQQYNGPYYEDSAGSFSYGVFICGDNPLTVLHSSSTQAQQGRKIAVIKESYGNAFVPYLTYNYEEVHIMDMRTFRKASPDDTFAAYCQKNGITDVLFLNGIMSANNASLLDSMTALFE